MDVLDASDSRLAELSRWLREDLGFVGGSLAPASGDASFRRYFRLIRGTHAYIAMDAPPQREDSAPFIKIARMLAGMNLNVPLVLARDLERGFLLLSDLGTRLYLDELPAPGAADKLYADALRALCTMQTADGRIAADLPKYDDALLMREMELMPDEERGMLNRLFEALARSAAAQPAAFVHRDYHSRNLLVSAENTPGILDFQDAVWGPVTYDLASLLKDCYIAWPAQRVRGWVLQYREKLLEAGFPLKADAAEFLRWFDLIGLQRHIKVLGIFSRLYYRDGKPQYLKDLPRVLDYVRDTVAAFPETAEFADFLKRRIDPLFKDAQQRELA
jgi:hypothetical protein